MYIVVYVYFQLKNKIKACKDNVFLMAMQVLETQAERNERYMKKLLTGTLALMLLCGCGGSKQTTTVCKGNVEGQEMETKLTFDDDDLTFVEILTSVEAGSAENAKNFKSIVEAQKDELLADLGDGSDVVFDVNDTKVEMTIKIDVSKAKEDVDIDDLDFSGTKAEIIQAMEEEGLTCQ